MAIMIGKREMGGLCGQKLRITVKKVEYIESLKANIKNESIKKQKERLTWTKKYGCPFTLMDVKLSTED